MPRKANWKLPKAERGKYYMTRSDQQKIKDALKKYELSEKQLDKYANKFVKMNMIHLRTAQINPFINFVIGKEEERLTKRAEKLAAKAKRANINKKRKKYKRLGKPFKDPTLPPTS